MGVAAAQDRQEGPLESAVRLLTEFAAIPSESANHDGVSAAAGWLDREFTALGFKVSPLDSGPGGAPFLFADREARPGAPRVLFYMHFDTQPPGPAADWRSTGGEPFRPTLLSGRFEDPASGPLQFSDLPGPRAAGARLYGRGVADDKAPIVMHLVALREWLASTASNDLSIRFLLDGGEEAGSPGIAALLARHGALLASDLLILCDGPMDPLGRASVYLGARGDMHMKLRVRTAARSGHSGNYGLLPSAVWEMAGLLSSMRGPHGTLAVAGITEGVVPPTPAERGTLAEASRAESVIAAEHGVTTFDGDPSLPYFERLLFAPSLIVNQLASGRPGNQVPHEAEAVLEVRLVTRQEPKQVFEAISRHVAKRSPSATLEFLDGVPAGRMDPGDPFVAAGIAAAERAAGGSLLVYPTLGGTLPLLNDFEKAGFRYLGLPLVNFDNAQHVANENLRIERLPGGIQLLSRRYPALAESLAAPRRLSPGRRP